MTPFDYCMEKVHREFREQAGILISGTTTSNVVEESPLTVETILQAIKSMPPPLPPSPIPTEFDPDPRMPKHLGLIVAKDTNMSVGVIIWVDDDNVEITVLRNATNTYAKCGYDVYEVIMRKLEESRLLFNQMRVNV